MRKPTLNDWFLALSERAQAIYREDKWMLANAAFDAGVIAGQAAAKQEVEPAGDPVKKAAVEVVRSAAHALADAEVAKVIAGADSRRNPGDDDLHALWSGASDAVDAARRAYERAVIAFARLVE